MEETCERTKARPVRPKVWSRWRLLVADTAMEVRVAFPQYCLVYIVGSVKTRRRCGITVSHVEDAGDFPHVATDTFINRIFCSLLVFRVVIHLVRVVQEFNREYGSYPQRRQAIRGGRCTRRLRKGYLSR